MRRSLALAAFALTLSLAAIPTPAAAQYVYGVSAILVDTELDHAYGYSATLLDYEACYYYDAGVVGTLREEPLNDLASDGVRGICSAEVYTDGPAQENRVYTEYSNHYLFAIYYVYQSYDGGWYDPFGYGFLGGGDYGSGFSFPGCYYCGGYFAQTQQDLGSTNASQLNPEDTCNKTPTLIGQSEVTRATSVEFKVDNLCPGAQISGWKFTDSSGNVVSRTTQTSAASWEGPIVTNGTVQVTVKQTAERPATTLSKTIQVRARSGFAFQPAPAEKKPNATFDCGPLKLKVDEAPPTRVLGLFILCQARTSFDYDRLQEGPNRGYWYTTAIRDSETDPTKPPRTTFAWTITPPLEDPSSEFYRAQCGNYDPNLDQGYMNGAQLRNNIVEHESGSTNSHYSRFVAAVADPNKNVGLGAEGVVGVPSVNEADFKSRVSAVIGQRQQATLDATKAEPCSEIEKCAGNEGNCDPTCTYRGGVNFSPYATCTLPMPQNLQAIAVSASRVELTWLDNYSTETGFQLVRKNDGIDLSPGITTNHAANTASAADTSVQPGHTYVYTLYAVNSVGLSPPSVSARVTVPSATPPPAPPTTVSGAAASPTQVNLSWADTSPDELGFKIERSSAGGAFAEIGAVGSNVTTYADTTVVAGSTYAYQVRAWNGGGSSAPSASVTVAVPTSVTGTPPAAPCCLWSPSSYSWTGRVDIEWLDLSNNEQGFTIERSENWGGWFAPVGWVGANTTSWQDFDWLQGGNTYIYRVVATNDAGSAMSDELAVTVPLWTY